MGMSAAAHRRQVRVIGPIWPTANRPTIEWAAQINVVRTSSRIGLAQAECMSPVLGAVASGMNVFGGFENGQQSAGALSRKRSASLGNETPAWHRPSRSQRQSRRAAPERG